MQTTKCRLCGSTKNIVKSTIHLGHVWRHARGERTLHTCQACIDEHERRREEATTRALAMLDEERQSLREELGR